MSVNDNQWEATFDQWWQGGEIHRVPDESSCSKWAEQSRIISDNCQEGFTRSRNLTIKGLLHKKTLRERKKRSIADKYK